jgi:uncharacterized phage-associated protein
MIITHYRKKLINSIIYFVIHTKYCGITKLMKLLYFLDFWHFKQTGKPVTGSEYFAWDKGPVPRDVHNELSGKMKTDMAANIKRTEFSDTSFLKFNAKKKFDPEYFSERELELLENISFMFNDLKSDDIIEIAHLKNKPWIKTKDTKGLLHKIDYMLAVDEDDDSISIEQAKDTLDEIAEVYKIFGVA